MNFIRSSFWIALVAVVVSACASGGGAPWTYAPLGPTPSAGGSAAPSAAPSPGGSPGLAIEVTTEQATSLAFTPNVLDAPPATLVTVNYINNSNLPHNINFFAGSDNSAPSLGATEVVTGPNAPRSVSFTTPEQPGDYLFWCDVHSQQMIGTLRVAQ